VATLTSWTTGWLKFRDMPLREAIAEVNRYTAHPLILEDGTHANQRVNGSFRSGDVAAFIEAVTALYALKAEPQADGTTLLKS
jgi:transmembrane sensor